MELEGRRRAEELTEAEAKRVTQAEAAERDAR
jgi:hypothetical protein